MSVAKLSVDDPQFVDKIIFEVKSQGHFDAFRKECLADVDTQPAFQNLHSRVEDSVQKFLIGRVWTPETNKNRLREDMRHSIIRAGYLENGVSRIVDQVMEHKMNSIQSKVEEILYKYVGIDKPLKKEKTHNGALEVDTDLLPTDLEQVSPDSDKKSPEIKDEEEIEEEIVEDEDFESPAFEPIEPVAAEKETSNLSDISGLTSQDSVEEKEVKDDSQLSQISSVQDVSPDPPVPPEIIDHDIPPPPGVSPERSNFDLQKDQIEFTGTNRKSITLDDSNNSGEPEKALQPQDVPSNTMEIDNLYENDTTDSSEMRMEIDLKDDTTQESSKVEESSQDSQKHRHHHHKSRHKSSSSSHRSSSRHHHSSSSKSRHKSSSHKKSSSSSSRRDHDKDRKPSTSTSKPKDDHHQEKTSSSRRRRSTDHDSNDAKKSGSSGGSSGEKKPTSQESQEVTETNKPEVTKPVVVDEMLTENCEMSIDQVSTTKDAKPEHPEKSGDEDGFCGFSDNLKLPENPWFECLRNEASSSSKKIPTRRGSNNSGEQKTSKVKSKQKSKSPDTGLTNGADENSSESRAQQQRYTSEDLFKPRFHFGTRNRRRGQAVEEEMDAIDAMD